MKAGDSLLHYRLAEKIGEGGMGQVWRATDSTLGRDVAIKILPPEFAADPERLARFDREAKVLAALNHPNIAAIHGFHEADGIRFLAMEMVPGEGLDQRIARGPIPADEAKGIALKIAEALEYAHERGIVHRDLKPANIRITPDGTVKVLDFGLAKAMVGDPTASGPISTPTILPTVTSAGTAVGMILGTAAYMSPEQARGKPVDRRADIWAFGVVAVEMLTGKRLFEGETVSDTIAGVLTKPLELDALPYASLWKRCLERDSKLRLRDIGEARIALERPAESKPMAVARASWPLVAAIGVLAVAAIWGWFPREEPPSIPERRVEIAFPSDYRADSFAPPALSPDGRHLAVVGVDAAGLSHLLLRSLDGFHYERLEGTEGAVYAFWSPDSTTLGFIAKGGLKRLALSGRVVETILPAGVGPRGASWGKDGTILYAPSANAPIWRVPAAGGAPERVTTLDPAVVDGSHRLPTWLPDGEHFLFSFWSNNAKALAEVGGLYLASVRGGEPRRLTRDTGSFVLTGSRLLFHREGNLLAVPFDPQTFAIGSQSSVAATGLRYSPNSGIAAVSASRDGDVVFLGPNPRPQPKVEWLDRKGAATPVMALSQDVMSIRISPDLTRFAVAKDDANGLTELSVGELGRGTLTRLTRSQNDSFAPVWSPDGTRIAFNNRDSGTEDLYVISAAGTRPKELLWIAKDVDTNLYDWSADGRYLLFMGRPRQGVVRSQIWIYDERERKARAWIAEDYNVGLPVLSPDGRWLAYVSDESGRLEVYLRSFPDLERKIQVSTRGGGPPHWRRDGGELLFFGGPQERRGTWSVSIAPSAAGLSIGDPVLLFAATAEVSAIDAAPDHSRFLAVVQPGALEEPPFHLIQGWRDERSR